MTHTNLYVDIADFILADIVIEFGEYIKKCTSRHFMYYVSQSF